MKLVFVSNFLNHHQIPLCENLRTLCKDFAFVATSDDPNAGYQTASEADYLVKWYMEGERETAERLILDADAVIFGACPTSLIAMRMEKDRLSFFYSERFFKKGVWRRFIPQTRKALHERIVRYKNKNMYVLCASAYLPYDLSLLGFPAEKCFQWGYFPDCVAPAAALGEKAPNSILWAGRFLSWKHPEIAVEVAKRLRADGISFTLDLAGEGEGLDAVQRTAQENGLSDCVRFLGSMPHDALLTEMQRHAVFLMTSDFYEGWGAVLNEAMGSACAVVASHAAGSTPYLVGNNENGLVFRSGDADDAYRCAKTLLVSPDRAKDYQQKAYAFMRDQFNASVAAERLCAFIEICLEGPQRFDSGPLAGEHAVPSPFDQNGIPQPFERGILSRAPVLPNSWFRTQR